MGTILDRSGNLCLRLSGWCFSTREAIDPIFDDPANIPTDDRILAGVLARLTPPSAAFQPSQDDQHAALLAQSICATVWIHRGADGRLVAAAQRQPGGA
jgi:hypothetical protein